MDQQVQALLSVIAAVRACDRAELENTRTTLNLTTSAKDVKEAQERVQDCSRVLVQCLRAARDAGVDDVDLDLAVWGEQG